MLSDVALNAGPTIWDGTPPITLKNVPRILPLVYLPTARTGAAIGFLLTSNGLATIVTDLIGSSGKAAAVRMEITPPRHQPSRFTGLPPVSSETFWMAAGTASAIQCSSPRSRSASAISP